MGTAASAEPCVYERLWESIAVLRESGQRYGMSERDIERFITQVLQTNEPQDQDLDPEPDQDQPGFPLLRVTAKCALAVCLLLVLGLSLSAPQSHPGPLTLGFNWTCPLGAARLLDLPIAKKYNLREFRGWWNSPPLHTSRLHSRLNSSVCRARAAPLVLQGGSRWTLQRPHLQQLLQSQPNSASVETGVRLEGPANYTVLWSTEGAVESLLFPSAPPPLLDAGGTALRRCVVWNLRPTLSHLLTGVRVQGWVVLGEGQASLLLSPLCPHQSPVQVHSPIQLRAGDRVFCDSRLWRAELIPGPDQTLFCDGSTSELRI